METKRREYWNGHCWQPADDSEIDDLTLAGLLEKAFDAGFDAACDYWENPVRHINTDINELQERECKKVVKLLG